MKSEVAFFKDKRASLNSAEALVKLFRFLGYTDKQIIEEFKKIKADREKAKQEAQNDTREQ
jgi:hypothetical protein